MAEEMPELEPDDAQMHLELYKNGVPEKDFGHFEDQRETNIELLHGRPADAGSRKAQHRAAGEITLSQMLHERALHDLGHVRQIAALARHRERVGADNYSFRIGDIAGIVLNRVLKSSTAAWSPRDLLSRPEGELGSRCRLAT